MSEYLVYALALVAGALLSVLSRDYNRRWK